MAKDTITLDQLLRQRAKDRLEEQIDNLFKRFEQDLWNAAKVSIRGVTIGDEDKSKATSYAGHFLDAIKEALIERATPDIENEEVEAFVKRVQALGDEIDELRQGQI